MLYKFVCCDSSPGCIGLSTLGEGWGAEYVLSGRQQK